MNTNPILIGFIRKEIIQTLRDKKSWFALFFVPVFQLVLFGMAVSTEIRDIKLGVVYKPNDSLCRRVADRFYASGWFVPAGGADPDPFRWVQSGHADAVLVAPEGGLTRSVERGNGRIQLLINSTNVLKCQSIESYASALFAEAAAHEKITPTPKPVFMFDTRILYNPQLESSFFLVPGVICNVLGILTIILISTALTREKEQGTFESLIASPAKPWEILLGKSVPYVLLAMLDGPAIWMVALLGFRVPMRGSYSALALAALAFVVTTVAIGILISTIANNQQQAMLAGFLFLFPAITLSGLAFPVENMPLVLKAVAYLNPFKYFVDLLRNIMLKGGDLELVVTDTGILFLLGGAAILFTFVRFRRTLN